MAVTALRHSGSKCPAFPSAAGVSLDSHKGTGALAPSLLSPASTMQTRGHAASQLRWPWGTKARAQSGAGKGLGYSRECQGCSHLNSDSGCGHQLALGHQEEEEGKGRPGLVGRGSRSCRSDSLSCDGKAFPLGASPLEPALGHRGAPPTLALLVPQHRS